MKYKCTKCNKFLGEIKRLDLWTFTRSNRIEVVENTLIVTCKCGGKNIIDLKPFQEEKENE